MLTALGSTLMKRESLQADYDGLYWDTEKREYKYKYQMSRGNMKWSEWTTTPKHKFIKKHGPVFDSRERVRREK